ncbi:MAG TPA: hypothetical protein VFF06_24395 [Polyangia bacterium]|nr:hypothetical protein [Polyangia bacterium]
MDADRKQRIARATAELLRAVRAFNRAKELARRDRQRPLLDDPSPPEFAQAVKAFAEAIAS